MFKFVKRLMWKVLHIVLSGYILEVFPINTFYLNHSWKITSLIHVPVAKNKLRTWVHVGGINMLKENFNLSRDKEFLTLSISNLGIAFSTGHGML